MSKKTSQRSKSERRNIAKAVESRANSRYDKAREEKKKTNDAIALSPLTAAFLAGSDVSPKQAQSESGLALKVIQNIAARRFSATPAQASQLFAAATSLGWEPPREEEGKKRASHPAMTVKPTYI
ncbi:MAG: hypothetical protein H6853_07240 [Rhodospirillales bacterium]|nr:hypothetical protein [Alphaproteobacteria bacterium]USO03323.1 MAG: hypothetical protein H6853_07240 [Rhodospirillales bacterium]